MFGIGSSELVLILLIALLVLGPHRLPEVLKIIAKTLAQFRKVADEVKKEIAKEGEIEGIQESLREIGEVPRLVQEQMEKEVLEMERLKKEVEDNGSGETGEEKKREE